MRALHGLAVLAYNSFASGFVALSEASAANPKAPEAVNFRGFSLRVV